MHKAGNCLCDQPTAPNELNYRIDGYLESTWDRLDRVYSGPTLKLTVALLTVFTRYLFPARSQGRAGIFISFPTAKRTLAANERLDGLGQSFAKSHGARFEIDAIVGDIDGAAHCLADCTDAELQPIAVQVSS